MKVRSSVKPICEKCKVIKRKGSVRIICASNAGSSLPHSFHNMSGGRKGHDTEHAWDKIMSPIKDN